ncbi:hypothetical protein [Paracoccus homiensis]|uniref:hypothetical protein n=1 Tax=Paracoccus homiensis TaxID=364199 RepID=UPI00398CB181
MREHYDKIIDFITTDSFKQLMLEMSTLSAIERPKFVAEVLINSDELKSRGVIVPDGILIQRSAFGDRRPTLFAVKHFLPDEYADVWQNVNITFDNEYVDSQVARDRETCWRKPLKPSEQASLMAEGQSLENA